MARYGGKAKDLGPPAGKFNATAQEQRLGQAMILLHEYHQKCELYGLPFEDRTRALASPHFVNLKGKNKDQIISKMQAIILLKQAE